MSLCIGITTYNRLDLLKRMSSSLMLSTQIEECNIRIFDDKSTEFGYKEIKEVFPAAVDVIIRKENLGADRNMRQMFVDFLSTSDDYLLIADSDLIFNPEWYIFFKEHSNLDVLSLYNSASHITLDSKITLDKEMIIQKNHIGAAGTIFKREIVKLIIENVPPSRSYDWDWSKFLIERNFLINVSNRSYVQHIGINGTNNDGASVVDFGLNFFPGNTVNEYYLIDFFQSTLIAKDVFIRKSLSPKILIRKMKSMMKIIKWKLSNYSSK